MPATFNDISHFQGNTAMPLSVAKRLHLIKGYLKNGSQRFLDCGCGAGGYVEALVEQKVDAHGIEYDERTVSVAQTNPRLKGRIVQGDLQAIPMESDSWDYVMLNEVLEHVGDELKVLREVYRVLKPGGILFIFSPNRWFPFETHGVDWKGTRRHVPHWVPFIPYLPVSIGEKFFFYWGRNYWQKELAGLATKANFSIVDRNFVWQTFENISGTQPGWLSRFKNSLRAISNHLEQTPFLRRFGVSQVLVCLK